MENMIDDLQLFVCVDKHQKEADMHHANWILINAYNRNQAKYMYSKIALTEYKDVLCTLKRRFVRL